MSVAGTSDERRVEVVKRIGNAWEMAGVSINCELCSHHHWALVATGEAEGLGMPFRHDDEVDLANCFLTYAVQCKNCGNVRVMSKARVEELAYGGKDATNE